MATARAEEASVSTYWCSYHVFLTFRGKSTGKFFIDHLYRALVHAGIGTFRNDGELEQGISIEFQLKKAIQESRISVVVFTKYFASSRWCLEELVNILDRKKTTSHSILPVFYDVDPSQVRKQTGTYAKAFAKHEERFRKEIDGRKREGKSMVQRWRDTLKEVADLAGLVLEDGHELKLIQKIVEEVWRKLNHTILGVAANPIGIGSRIKDISLFLQDCSTDINMVIIHGIGGIGKTTIAETVYNLNFERYQSTSFLPEIRETSKERNGVVRLQKHLLSDILEGKTEKIYTVEEGMIKIKEALYRKRVLIVLDDVDEMDHLNALVGMGDWVYPGSKVIITTRRDELLKACETCFMYKPREMDPDESLQLFSWHAFGQDHPKKGYMEHSKSLVGHCQGLPLALQVLGSSLSGGGADFWGSVLEKLQAICDPDILKVLEMSYKSLQDDHEKDLFLDIACFFVGKDKDYAVKVLNECDFYTTAGIQNLIDRCLLTVSTGNKLRMHQLLQEMGRDIVRRESPKEPGKRSRLWHHKDTYQVIREETATGYIEALSLDMDVLKEDKPAESVTSPERHNFEDFPDELPWIYSGNSSKRRRLGFFSHLSVNSASTELCSTSKKIELKTNAFSGMENLRLLQLNSVKLSGGYERFPKKLKWLIWHGFPLNSVPSDFPLESLVVLEMHYSNLGHVWQGTKFLRLLKVLDLSHSPGLTETPDFSGLSNLERVILKDCKNLVKVHQSVGELQRLMFLNLKGCGNLRKLPKGIVGLKSLGKLVLSGCSKLVLPTSLYSLFRFWISPRSAQSTTSPMASLPFFLVYLDLSGCNLTDDAIHIAPNILSLLHYLNIGGNPISVIPDSIKGLNLLESLLIVECTRLHSLPELPSSLKMLDARGCRSLEKITNLPNLLSSLDFRLGDCGKLVEVQGLFKLEPMQNIDKDMINMLSLIELDNIEGVEVELCSYLTCTKTKGPIQGLYEFGVFSTFVPGSKVPAMFNKKSTGSPICFSVPSLPNISIQGLNVCVVYAKHNKEYMFEGGHYIRISNKTKGLRWIYDPAVFAIPRTNESLLWLSHWKFGNHVEGGDQLIVTLSMRYTVREFGINLLYDEQEVTQNRPDFSFDNVIGGQLSAYQISTGVYFLCHHF